MFQLRRILLSGLVALLMVGMVVAGDVATDEVSDVVTAPIGAYVGGWNIDHSLCVQNAGSDCFKLWINFDLGWVKNLFN